MTGQTAESETDDSTTDEASEAYYETYPGGPVKLPLRTGVPVNRVDRETNYKLLKEEEALRRGLKAEHREFPDHHGEQPRDDCPRCNSVVGEDR